MSEPLLDAPNQQVVRPDGSGPGVEHEGEGGSTHEPEADPLEAMTKADLLAYAEANGIEVDESLKKAEIVEAIREAGG